MDAAQGKCLPSITHSFVVGGTKGDLTVTIENGQVADLFIDLDREGSALGGWVRAWAVLFSTSLQAGVPLGKLTRQFKTWSFGDWGPTNNKDILIAKSIPDYIARWLELKFGGEEEEENA